MKARSFRVLSKEELKEKLEGLKKQLMELQFKRRVKVEKPHLFKQTKKDIARILTVLNEIHR
ncbi:MAG: 50S ribosomal protein L29 [Candidatus Omnitrophica bacterium]|nr:50S ribosomal protein L29 [Candidatus Omnitrophota bacterium]MBU0878606.1 50S ribosomal protein L29 [Candidatus Omnitrophota bacterium]MBU0897275.1 50S ribosomal protein L29 [Candidatus Omnitrophota bacterium]MBU1811233.1 50S ribosomal protein L29 [Candidatus Omnitrophota bacterium]